VAAERGVKRQQLDMIGIVAQSLLRDAGDDVEDLGLLEPCREEASSLMFGRLPSLSRRGPTICSG